MGIQDRDYYREWWAEKEGLVKRTAVHSPVTQNPKPKEWRPFAVLMMTIAICCFEYGVYRVISYYVGH